MINNHNTKINNKIIIVIDIFECILAKRLWLDLDKGMEGKWLESRLMEPIQQSGQKVMPGMQPMTGFSLSLLL